MTTTTPHRPAERVSVWSIGHELLDDDGLRYVTTHLNQGRKALTVTQALRYAGGILGQVGSAEAAARHLGDELAEPGYPLDRYDAALAAVRTITALPAVVVDPDVLEAAQALRDALLKAGR
jgi:hypothetical protein